MASNSETSLKIETPTDCKPKRRSSIFRPNTESAAHCNDEIFPPNYKVELLQEVDKWSEAYTNVKSEYIELRNKDRCRSQHAPSVNLENYERYLRRAEDFCCQINNMVELHDNAINYLNLRSQELKTQLEATSKIIHEKLNV